MTSSTAPTAGQQGSAGRLSASGTTVLATADQPGGSVVRRSVLPGGLRVITEQLPGVLSASVGVWIGVGSNDETPEQHGCSHFLEHLLFKGTTSRTAMDISASLDAVGGEFNAFTAKEYTCFHARVLHEDLALAVDVLGDMITDATLDPADVEAERNVILDEIAMHDDDPDDVVHNLFAAQAWGDSGLGRSIAGSEESIGALTGETIRDFRDRHYVPGNMVIAAAGHLDHDSVVAMVTESFARGGFLDGDGVPRVLDRTEVARPAQPGESRLTRGFEQVNLVLGVNGLTRTDERRFALGVLNAALGGGTSSRLFQQVREERGLAYSVFSFAAHHADAGLVGVAVGCLPDKVDDVLTTVRAALADVAAHGIDADELARGKGQLRGGLVLGLEDSGSRMSRLAKAELVYDELMGLDEVIARIDAVTVEQVQTLAAELFAQPELLAIVGPAERGVSAGR